MARPIAFLLALRLAVGAAEELWNASQTSIAATEPRENVTVVMHVHNLAAAGVLLANCEENHTLPSGGNASLTLRGEVVLWAVPEAWLSEWNCSDPFDDLFYVFANFTDGASPAVGIGYDLDEEEDEKEDEKEDEEGEESAGESDAGVEASGGIAGLRLAVAPLDGEGNRTVRCSAVACDPELEVATLPGELTLTIFGPQASPLSFWRHYGRGRRHYHRRHYHRHHHGRW